MASRDCVQIFIQKKTGCSKNVILLMSDDWSDFHVLRLKQPVFCIVAAASIAQLQQQPFFHPSQISEILFSYILCKSTRPLPLHISIPPTTWKEFNTILHVICNYYYQTLCLVTSKQSGVALRLQRRYMQLFVT